MCVGLCIRLCWELDGMGCCCPGWCADVLVLLYWPWGLGHPMVSATLGLISGSRSWWAAVMSLGDGGVGAFSISVIEGAAVVGEPELLGVLTK